MRMDEQELVQRVQEGDEMAFAAIVRNYKDKIVNYLYRLTGDYQKAVELAQETFIRVYFKANKYKPFAPFSSWVFAIASNLAKTELKKSRRFQVVSLDSLEGNHKSIAFSDNPSDPVLSKKILKVLNSLPPRYRIPVVLKDVEGFSQEEIAQVLRKPVGTIKARISRGRDFLKKELRKVLGENEFSL